MLKGEFVIDPFVPNRFRPGHHVLDHDEYSRFLRQWNVEFDQLGGGRLQCDLHRTGSDHFAFTRIRFNCRLFHGGALPQNMYTFGILARPNRPCLWRGHEIHGDNVIFLPPRGKIDCVSPPDFDIFIFSVSEKHLARISLTLGLPEPAEKIHDEAFAVSSDKAVKGLRGTLLTLCREVIEHPMKGECLRIWKRLKTEVPEQLLHMLFSSTIVTLRGEERPRDRTLARAVEYISACAQGPLTVRDICRGTGVSQRTLEYAFRARFDLSPKAYIRTYRLNRVRNDLRMSDPDSTSITELANRWGFRHMGQFAADYRNLFAALPSETLSRCRRVQEGK